MRVGIVTFFPNNNYGCLLQAFALQRKIENFGNDVEIIALEPSYIYFSKIRGFWDIPHIIVGFFRYVKRHQSLRNFGNASKIKSTKVYKNICDIKELEYDVLVAGSDQIWHSEAFWQRSGGSDYYFLNFALNIKKRISYAASISQKKWPLDFEVLGKKYLEKFDKISVREVSAAEYLKSIGFLDVTVVCDPTLLHNGMFYVHEFAIDKTEFNIPFLFRIREKIPDSVTMLLKDGYTDVFMKVHPSKFTVTQWLSNIYNASFILTDSFHCSVFCLLFHKRFLVIPNLDKGIGMNERFATLLGKTHLEYRCLNDQESSDEVLEKLNRPVDWDAVDRILDEWRCSSLNWLKKALEN